MTSQVTDLYAELGIELRDRGGTDAAARCFAAPSEHRSRDRHPSVSVNLTTGAWICHGCGARGGAYDAAILAGRTPRTAMDLLIRYGLAERRHYPGRPSLRKLPGRPPSELHRLTRNAVPRVPAVTSAQIDTWHDRLLAQPELLRRLEHERAITPATIRHFQMGWDGTRITIPLRVRSPGIGALRWQPFDRDRSPKMLALPGTRRKLFPAPETLPDRDLVICEGEPDALAAHSAGIPAVAIPGVAGWRPHWAKCFRNRTVTIVLDCDTEGRRCATRIATDLAACGVDAVIVDLNPGRTDGYDLTDHLTGA